MPSTAPTVDTPWMTTREAAAYSRTSVEEVNAALRSRALRGFQRVKNGTWKVHREDIDAWLKGDEAAVEPSRITRPAKAKS